MSVENRTCFYEMVDGTFRPAEWCLINVSGIGLTVEPHWPFPSNGEKGEGKDDFTSDFQKVNEFKQSDEIGILMSLNSGLTEGPWLHGGRHYPRTGR